MVVGGGRSQIEIIRKATSLGLSVAVVDKNSNAPGFKYADYKINLDTQDYLGCLKQSEEIGIDAITTSAAHHALTTIGYVNDKLGLYGHSLKTINHCTNKDLFRKKLVNSKYSIKYKKCNDVDEVLEFTDEIGFPIIMKLTDSSGSRGVVSCQNDHEVRTFYDCLKKESNSGKVLCEEYVQGQEYSIESITTNNKTKIIAITEKCTSGRPYFVEIGHVTPPHIPESDLIKIKNSVISVLDMLEVSHGPTHSEVILSDNGPKIVEVNPRPGGDQIWSKLVPLSTNIDILELTIMNSLGHSFELNSIENSVASINYFYSEKNSFLDKIIIPDFVKNANELAEITIDISQGQKVKALEQSRDRFGYFICKTNTHRKNNEIVDFIRDNINLVLD